jgi:hypothetical protein
MKGNQMSTPQQQARIFIKAINRHVKRRRLFEGGRTFGVDYTTWCVTYPQLARAYQAASEILTGRNGRFLPRF